MPDHKPVESPFLGKQERAETIKGMRELADWLEAHPDVPVYSSPYMALFSSWAEGDPIATSPQRMAKAMGKAEKSYDSTYIALKQGFSGGVYYEFNFMREEVCEPKVVGEREKKEPRYQVGDKLLTLEELNEFKTEIVVGTEPIVEYVCPDSLLRQAS